MIPRNISFEYSRKKSLVMMKKYPGGSHVTNERQIKKINISPDEHAIKLILFVD